MLKKIEIKATPFFEQLKLQDVSMWDIFAQMIDGETKLIQFLDKENHVLFDYELPTSLEKLKEDQKEFAKEYASKINQVS